VLLATSTFEAAILSSTRSPSARIVDVSNNQIDVDLESVEVTRTLERTVVPEEARIASGVTSSQGTVVVTGSDARVFHPLSITGSSALGAGVGVEVAAIAGANENLRLLTGVVQETSSDGLVRQGGTTRLSIVDYSEVLHVPVTLPVVGAGETQTKRANAPLDALGPIVHCLHSAGLRVTPAFRSEAVFAAPLVGGLVPEIGSVEPLRSSEQEGSAAAVTPTFIQGKFGPMWNQNVVLPQTCRASELTESGLYARWPTAYGGTVAWMIEGFVDVSWPFIGSFLVAEVRGARADNASLGLLVNRDGTITARLSSPGSLFAPVTAVTATFAADGTGTPTGQIYVAVALRWTTAGSGRIDVARSTATLALRAASNTFVITRPAVDLQATIYLDASRKMQQVSVSMDPVSSGAIYTGGTPVPVWGSTDPVIPTGTSLEATGHRIWQLPEVVEQDAYNVIKDIAGGAGATVDYTEQGIFRLRSYTTMRALSGVPVRTLLIERDLVSDGKWISRTSAVRNVVSARVRKLRFTQGLIDDDNSEFTFRWPSVIEIPTGVTKFTARAQTDRPLCITDRYLTLLTTTLPPSSSNARNSATIVVGLSAAAASPLTSVWGNASVRQIGPNELELTTENLSGSTLYAVWPKSWGSFAPPPGSSINNEPGAPGIILNGSYGIDEADRTIFISTSSPLPAISRSALVLQDSPWRQDDSHTTQQLADILADTSQVRSVSTEITLRGGDPRIQAGDTIRLQSQADRFDSDVPSLLALVTRTVHGYSVARGLYTRLTVVARVE